MCEKINRVSTATKYDLDVMKGIFKDIYGDSYQDKLNNLCIDQNFKLRSTIFIPTTYEQICKIDLVNRQVFYNEPMSNNYNDRFLEVY